MSRKPTPNAHNPEGDLAPQRRDHVVTTASPRADPTGAADGPDTMGPGAIDPDVIDPDGGGAEAAFGADGLAAFARLYPEQGGLIPHRLVRHPLLTVAALADLADRLQPEQLEYNRGNLPIGVANPDGHDIGNGLSAAETIRGIETNKSWAVMRTVETDPAYAALLHQLLAPLRPTIEARTGEMLNPSAFLFLSSPDATTPFHIDPEHNILLQIRGSKTFTLFPVNDERIISHREHERYHTGGHRNVPYLDEVAPLGHPHLLTPGQAIHVPVMAPHWVKNGPEVSISLSITWRSEWSYAEADARGCNSVLRRLGVNPKPPRRWPGQNWAKAYAYRAYRRLGLASRTSG